MKRTVYEAYKGDISLYTLDQVEHLLSIEEREELSRKKNELIASMKFYSIENEILADKFFKLGYLAAHIIGVE